MKLILLVFISFPFFSCYQFQYLTVSSFQLSKDKTSNLIVENDTLKLTYDFSGYRAPIKITIYNKSDEPLEINWKKSALVINDQALSYYSPNLLLNGTIEQDSSQRLYSNDHSYYADVRVNIYINEPSQFIPPKSSISKITVTLPRHNLVPLPANLKKETYKTRDNSVKFVREKYTLENSPITFRSYLSFNYAGNNENEFSIDHHFYVAEIWQSASEPFYFPQELVKRGDIFHLSDR